MRRIFQAIVPALTGMTLSVGRAEYSWCGSSAKSFGERALEEEEENKNGEVGRD